ncbi:MAG: penicillin-binding protein activator, partial [Anaerolineae bacterium]|nr:penicillin-binding protein activator [Anaerolineae bacterium]
EMPWLLGANPELKQTIAAGRGNGASYTRLNALGADAFLLQTQFRRLQAGPDALLRGNTGLLSMNPQLQIQRELVLSTFDEGAVQPR